MKLLFDQNLSPRLASQLSLAYAGSAHVYDIGLDRVPDRVVWDYARAEGFTLVTRDADFSELSEMLGFPPKVIWIRRGNCSTREIELLLTAQEAAIRELHADDMLGILTIF